MLFNSITHDVIANLVYSVHNCSKHVWIFFFFWETKMRMVFNDLETNKQQKNAQMYNPKLY